MCDALTVIMTGITTGIVDGGMAGTMTTTMMIDRRATVHSDAGQWRLNANDLALSAL